MPNFQKRTYNFFLDFKYKEIYVKLFTNIIKLFTNLQIDKKAEKNMKKENKQ